MGLKDDAQMRLDIDPKDMTRIKLILESDLKQLAKVKNRVLKLLQLYPEARDSSASLINHYEAAFGYSKSHESITRAARYWQNTIGVFPCAETIKTRRKQLENAHEESWLSGYSSFTGEG